MRDGIDEWRNSRKDKMQKMSQYFCDNQAGLMGHTKNHLLERAMQRRKCIRRRGYRSDFRYQ